MLSVNMGMEEWGLGMRQKNAHCVGGGGLGERTAKFYDSPLSHWGSPGDLITSITCLFLRKR